jgi:hypothetical protein
VKALALLAAALLAASAAQAASDCFEPVRASPGWRCRADVPGGPPVDYCLEHTNVFGTDPASRFFKLIATGPYPGHCSCRAKGKTPGAAFGADKSYLCLYKDTDAVVSGKITRRRMTGQTFSAAYNFRTVFSCQPDPVCDVQSVLDPDLPPTGGFVDLQPNDGAFVGANAPATVDIGYLGGCGGFASEAPNAVYHLQPGPAGKLDLANVGADARPDGLLVITPSGAVHCVDYYVYLPIEPGPYRAWVVLPAPGPVNATIHGGYHVD